MPLFDEKTVLFVKHYAGIDVNPTIRRQPGLTAWFGCVLVSFSYLYELPLTSQESSAAVKHHVEAARQAQAAHDLARAVEEYKKALALAPESAELYQNLGLVYHLQNHYREAIPAFERALKLHPDLWVSNLFLGMGYFKTNRFSEALHSLQKALDRCPKEGEVEGRFWLGITYMALESYPEAINELERRSELAPPDIEVLYSLAQAHSRYASQLFDRLLKVYPESASTLQFQAEQAQTAGRLEEAIEAYQAAATQRPDLEGVYLALGGLYQQMGDMARAAASFQTELRFNPYDIRSKEQLAQAKLSVGNSTLPAPEPEEATGLGLPALARTSKEDLFLQGVSYFHAGRWKEAASSFEAVLKLDPQHRRARIYLGRSLVRMDTSQPFVKPWLEWDNRNPDPEALYALGDIHAYLASTVLDKVIAMEPNSYRVHQITGERYEREGQLSKALEAYQTARSLKPDLPGIRFAVGSIYWKTRQFDEATEWLKSELRDNPHHALANYELGNIHVHRNEPAEAIACLKETISARPGLVEAHRDLAAALLQLQRYDEAIEHLKLAAKAAPEDQAVHALLANIYRKLGRREEEKAELMLYQQLNQREHERVRRKFSQLNELMDKYKPKPDSREASDLSPATPASDPKN